MLFLRPCYVYLINVHIPQRIVVRTYTICNRWQLFIYFYAHMKLVLIFHLINAAV